MKQQILDDICAKLNELQIPFTINNESSIYVNTDFYEIGYGAQFKKISYELTVLLDGEARSVAMYVKTVDQCLQVPGGAAQEAPAAQTTMFRKVKRFIHGKDGQGSVVTTDLGEVPNTVKNTAFKYGWRFSTALNLNKYKAPDKAEVGLSPPEKSEQIPEPDIPETEQEASAAPEAAPKAKRKKRGFKKLFGGK